MDNTSGSPPRKGSRWIADRILAAYEATTRKPAPEETRLSRPKIDDLVSRMLEEELERLKGGES